MPTIARTFHDVMCELRKVERRGNRHVVGVAYTTDNAKKLKGCATKLDWAMQEFQVTTKVDSCLKDLERHEELKAEIRNGHAETVDAVGKSKVEILDAIAQVKEPSTTPNLK
ncbi:hypothetical protein FRC02_005752 [Tulasnella sp. 418]|nr:hypothetical protein FRC02_005752 [Tulasnella sp. 418]